MSIGQKNIYIKKVRNIGAPSWEHPVQGSPRAFAGV